MDYTTQNIQQYLKDTVTELDIRHCWKNGFEHNKLAIFELKLQWVPQTFFGGSTWECVLLHEEMKIIY